MNFSTITPYYIFDWAIEVVSNEWIVYTTLQPILRENANLIPKEKTCKKYENLKIEINVDWVTIELAKNHEYEQKKYESTTLNKIKERT